MTSRSMVGLALLSTAFSGVSCAETCPRGKESVPYRDSTKCVVEDDDFDKLLVCWEQHNMTEYSKDGRLGLASQKDGQLSLGIVRDVAIKYAIPPTDPCMLIYEQKKGVSFAANADDQSACQAVCKVAEACHPRCLDDCISRMGYVPPNCRTAVTNFLNCVPTAADAGCNGTYLRIKSPTCLALANEAKACSEASAAILSTPPPTNAAQPSVHAQDGH